MLRQRHQAVAGANKIKPEAMHVTAEVTLVVNGHDYSIAVKLKAKIDGVDPRGGRNAGPRRRIRSARIPRRRANNIPVELEVL